MAENEKAGALRRLENGTFRGMSALKNPEIFDQSRDQVCDLQSTASTQPFMRSDWPLTAPEPL